MIPITLCAAALATPASSTCAPPTLLAFWPGDGEVVPPDVTPIVWEHAPCGPAAWSLTPVAAPSEVVWPALELLSDGLVRLVPAEPLAEGDWIAADGSGVRASTFTVVAGAPFPPPAPGAPSVVAAAEPECRASDALVLGADVSFAAPSGIGLVTLSWRSEQGEQVRTTSLATGDDLAVDGVVVLGEREGCVGVTLTDLAGTVVGEALDCDDEVPVCATGKPDGRGAAAEGCGCASGAGPGGALAALVALAALRLRAPARTARR